MSFWLSSCKQYHRYQNSLNKDFACRSMIPHQGPRLVPGAGRELSLTKNQVGTQGALPCTPSAVVASNLFGRITSSKSMNKKICIYAEETHFPRLASGYTYSHSEKPRSSSAALTMSAILKVEFQGRTKHHSPAQKAGLCRFSISLLAALPVFVTLRVLLAGLPRCLVMCASVLQLSPGLCRLGCAQGTCTTPGVSLVPVNN